MGQAIGALGGFTVGITADRRADEQAELLERRGAKVVHGPTIRTLPLADDDSLRATTLAVIERPPDVVVLTTGIGTRSWFAAAESRGLGDQLLESLLTRLTVCQSSSMLSDPRRTRSNFARLLESNRTECRPHSAPDESNNR